MNERDKYIDKLKDDLHDKLEKELNKYKEEMQTKSVDYVIGKSYETTCKTELVYIGYKSYVDEYELKALLKMDGVLNFLYDEWLDCDAQLCHVLEDSLSDVIIELGEKEEKLEERNKHSKSKKDKER